MVVVNVSNHLTKEEQIQLGSYYTHEKLVKKVYEYIKPYILKNKENVIIFDNAAGFGAFVLELKDYEYRASDSDPKAFSFLKKNLDNKKIYYSNSLMNVSREKYNIQRDSFLVMIGNPPYNDTTSEFRNGKKGKNLADEDLFDRDLGVSFLKSYNKLKADIVCVLHPLSYLIKKTNFNRLKIYKNNYILNKGIIFPSSWFHKTGSIKFPIMIGLYERNEEGMDYDYIKNFEFSILDNPKKFILSNYETTDGYINKYPPRKKDLQISPIGLYYYTFRDFNSLIKNTSFMNKKHYNGIVVTLQNFYKYAYLYSLKSLFKPKNIWIYGNLSPLVNKNLLEKNKNLFIDYALQCNHVLKNIDENIKMEIASYYGIDIDNLHNIKVLEKIIISLLKTLT